MNLVVHLQKKAIRKYGYEMATRQAWKCGIKANLVKRVIGLFKGQIVDFINPCILRHVDGPAKLTKQCTYGGPDDWRTR